MFWEYRDLELSIFLVPDPAKPEDAMETSATSTRGVACACQANRGSHLCESVIIPNAAAACCRNSSVACETLSSNPHDLCTSKAKRSTKDSKLLDKPEGDFWPRPPVVTPVPARLPKVPVPDVHHNPEQRSEVPEHAKCLSSRPPEKTHQVLETELLPVEKHTTSAIASIAMEPSTMTDSSMMNTGTNAS